MPTYKLGIPRGPVTASRPASHTLSAMTGAPRGGARRPRAPAPPERSRRDQIRQIDRIKSYMFVGNERTNTLAGKLCPVRPAPGNPGGAGENFLYFFRFRTPAKRKAKPASGIRAIRKSERIIIIFCKHAKAKAANKDEGKRHVYSNLKASVRPPTVTQ